MKTSVLGAIWTMPRAEAVLNPKSCLEPLRGMFTANWRLKLVQNSFGAAAKAAAGSSWGFATAWISASTQRQTSLKKCLSVVLLWIS